MRHLWKKGIDNAGLASQKRVGDKNVFVLEKRRYTWLDMYRIPFSCSPGSTLVVTAQKAMTALVNIFQVIVVAEFLDAVIAMVTAREWKQGVIWWFAAMLLLVSWKRVSYNIGRIFTKRLELQGARQVREQLVEKRSRLKYPLVEDAGTKELTNRVSNRLERDLSEMLQRFLNFFVIYIPRIIGVLLIIATQVWWLALLVMALTVPLIFISMRGGQRVYRANMEAAAYERRHKYLFEVLTGREAVEERSLFGFTGSVNDQWYEQYEKGRKVEIGAEAAFLMSMQGGSMVTSLIASAICVIMIPLTASGRLSIGLFISLCTAIYDLVTLMGWEMTRAVSQIAKYKEYMKDLTAFAALPEEEHKAQASDGGELPAFERLEFSHVTFRYPKTDVDILRDFSMVLEKGVHYAVVGENGAGKSTLIKLMTGLYRDYEGEILYNGVELRSIPQERWFRIFSCVFQDFARYALSVEENILLGGGELTGQAAEKERMRKAAEKLGLSADFEALPHGYETRLGKLDEESVDLSGGQWQRLAMARALMNEADILLLDEPTAALDPISESALYEKFGEISHGRTTVFISHRLGSTKLAEHIYVLKNGKVAEQGSHDSLLEKHGIYAEMFETQQAWYTQENE